MNDDLETQLERLNQLLQHHHLSKEEYTRAKDRLFLSDIDVNNYIVPHLARLVEMYEQRRLSETEYKEAKMQLKRRFNF